MAQAFSQALGQLISGDEASATIALGQLCTSKAGTPARHFEMATRLLQAMQYCHSSQPSAEAEARLAALALAEAQLTFSADAATQARGRQLAGHIYEDYLGDRAAAEASYRAAVQADPTLISAQARLDRLLWQDAFVAAKVHVSKAN
ncbi:MAG TPA: hypothetical protein VGM73_03665 [Candidatus Didemnitutus sp.]|jgi:hypothetical protein